MKLNLKIRTLLVTLVLLMGALPAAAVERPFALTGGGVAGFITDGAGNIIGANVTASGTATECGLWTAVGTLFFAPDPNDPTKLVATGGATLTAANGDKLEFVLENSVLDIPTSISTGNFRFVAGTGRFAAPSGVANYVVSQNLATGAFQLTAVGRIDF